MASLRARLIQLENKQRFLNWFAMERFLTSLTEDELATYARDKKLPEPIPNRPSPLDRLDRKTLLKLWEEDERIFGGRSHDELDYYTKNKVWPEQKGQFHYSMQDGKLCIEWRIEPEKKDAGLAGALKDGGYKLPAGTETTMNAKNNSFRRMQCLSKKKVSTPMTPQIPLPKD